LKFCAQESELVDIIELGSENPSHDVEDVLALVALPGMWAVTGGLSSDAHIVDVAGGTGHLDHLLRAIGRAASGSTENVESLGRSSKVDIMEALGRTGAES
jgi:hypothetical protein